MTAVEFYFLGIFALSLLLTLLYVFRWHKHFDVHMSVIFALIPIMTLGYSLMYAAHDQEAIVALLQVVYFGGCCLPWLTTMFMASLCGLRVSRPIRVATLLINSLLFCSVLTIGHSDVFYRSLTLERVGSAWVQHKEYGPLHTVYFVVIALYLVADLAIILYTRRKKKQVSSRVLLLLFIPILVTMIGYFMNHSFMLIGLEIVPLTYMLAQIVYLLIVRRMVLYNVSEMVIESMVQSGDVGFITVDSGGLYLGSNETAREILPPLRDLTVDRPVRASEALQSTVVAWLDRFMREPEAGKALYVLPGTDDAAGERIYTVTVDHLYDGRRRCGYQVFLEDDTQNQKYIRLLDKYNSDLQCEVAAKTERLVEMHDRLILGMAAMVESRDNSTGGHIRRTSEGVRILVEEMRRDEAFPLSDAFCSDIIKAAPMHDLGKIAVDDAILRKPGAFTPEEREKMQCHAAEGARIVHEILKDTDDADFRRIAENVAHYHHERMDGSGYPDGLRGDEIPREARIMAIADVYDALVSKRVYKEKFSFAEADRIILQGMGTQFDPRLQKYYEAARPKLEAFYAAEQGACPCLNAAAIQPLQKQFSI